MRRHQKLIGGASHSLKWQVESIDALAESSTAQCKPAIRANMFGTDWMPKREIYRIRVRQNIVVCLDPVSESTEVHIPETKLEISTQLAENHRQRGCIDGDYFFTDVDIAKYFALLSQDFIKKIVDSTNAELERIRSTSETVWFNPHISTGRDSE